MTGSITRAIVSGFCAILIAALGGCGPDYSPNTYNGSAMQQANKVYAGIVIGYREVKISNDGTVGTVTGGAAGGILGAEANSPTVPTALMALGGTVVGGVVGATLEHATGDTTGWEYIVREPKGDLVSVTQREPKPIAIGQRVLVIEGKQARIVPDYASAAFDAPSTDGKTGQDKTVQDKAATKASAPPPAAAPAAGDTSAASAASDSSTAPTAATATASSSPASTGASDTNANASTTPLATDKASSDPNTPAGTAAAAQPAATPPAPPASSSAGEGTSTATTQP